MRKIVALIFLVIISNHSYGQSGYFPVNMGASWTYAYGKEIYGGTPYENYTSEIKILDVTEVIEDKEYMIAKNSSGSKDGNQTIITSYFRFDSDGSLITKTDKNGKEFVTMKKDPKVGDTFTSQLGGTSKVADLNATIKTPIATYSNCLMIETEENQTSTRSYYKKNIGMIATTIVANGSEKIFIYLISE